MLFRSLYLRLRDASEKRRTRLIEFTPKTSGISRYAWKSVNYLPGNQSSVVSTTLSDSNVAAQLAKGPVVVVVGRANLAESDELTMAALATVMSAVPTATVLPVLRRGNVRGALTVGLDLRDSRRILSDAADGRIDCLVLVGSDPIADCPDSDLARRALAAVPNVIAVDKIGRAHV